MSTVTATVTAGQVFNEDSQGRVLVTKQRLNNLGVPTVQVSLTDSVDTEDLKANAVTAAKLSAALQDMIPKLSLGFTDGADGTGVITVQVQDAAGNSLAERFRVRAWIGDTDYGAPVAKTAFTVGTGTLLQTVEDKADLETITDATGLLSVTANIAATGTIYIMAEVDGRIYSVECNITN